MPLMNFDLEDGLPPVSFTLREADAERFMAFMAECHAAKQSGNQPADERKDAERYRWLRDKAHSVDWSETWAAKGIAYGIRRHCRSTAKEMDEAIDAALAQQSGKEQ